jgi:hypothetical protein
MQTQVDYWFDLLRCYLVLLWFVPLAAWLATIAVLVARRGYIAT